MSVHSGRWPEPVLQPDPHEGCFACSIAYLCHCFGHMTITPEAVDAFRASEKKWEGMFPVLACGLALDRAWLYRGLDEAEHQRFWLGPGTRPWVEKHLAAGQVGVAIVERRAGLAHALVVLESRGEDGILVMDPLYGHQVESWEWFLSIGPGQHGCHHLDGWYSRAART